MWFTLGGMSPPTGPIGAPLPGTGEPRIIGGSVVPGWKVAEEQAAAAAGKLDPPHVANTKPWAAQENAAYARMASQVITALGVYQQQTSDAYRLVEDARILAARVRGQLEAAAWNAWDANLTAAYDAADQVITPVLVNRERDLTSGYQVVMSSWATALVEWRRWMDLAESASNAILAPAQAAYDKRMQTAYELMQAANADAEDSWRRMYDGAERAGTILTSFPARAGAPPPA